VHDLQQRVLQRTLPDDLTTVLIDRLRAARADFSQAESDVSYVRRVVQGRLDIVGHEIQRRSGGESGSVESAGVVFNLPDILSVGGETPLGQRRAASFPEPGSLARELAQEVDQLVSPDDLSGVGVLTSDRLVELLRALEGLENQLSGLRQQLHARIDRIQNELGRRYGEGEASVDSLLQ